MKKIVLTLILLTSFMFSCINDNKTALSSDVQKNMNNSLDYINEWNQIELVHTDDKYGEWGGDSDMILIYSDGETIYADYSRYLGSTRPPMPPKEGEQHKKWFEHKELEIKIDSIEFDNDGIKLVETAILELAKQKIHNPIFISHGGIVNSVISKDSSFVIIDYSSNNWATFQKLKKKLTGK